MAELRLSVVGVLAMLERRNVITMDATEAEKCCGIPRDEDGFCQHRGHHPIYVRLSTAED